jgi:hypothetical protein
MPRAQTPLAAAAADAALRPAVRCGRWGAAEVLAVQSSPVFIVQPRRLRVGRGVGVGVRQQRLRTATGGAEVSAQRGSASRAARGAAPPQRAARRLVAHARTPAAPVWRSVLHKHRRWGSIGFVGCLSRCRRPHRLRGRAAASQQGPQGGPAAGGGAGLPWQSRGRTVGVVHGRHELDDRRLVGIVLRELQRELEDACTRSRGSRCSCPLLSLPTHAQRASPPSQMVPSGPNMMAFHFMMLSSWGDAFTPSGGSSCKPAAYNRDS